FRVLRAISARRTRSGAMLDMAGSKYGNGYGWLYIDGRRVRAHRFSYEMAHNIKLSPDVRVFPLHREPAVRQSRACHPTGRARPRLLVHADHQRRADGYCQTIWSQPVGSW